MFKIKKYLIAIGMMIVASVVMLFVVSMLAYWFKWQADKAMIGIIGTYILVGCVGGLTLNKVEKNKGGNSKRIGIGKQIIETLILSLMFIASLILCSCVGFQIPFELSNRFVLIWSLITCSIFGGMRL